MPAAKKGSSGSRRSTPRAGRYGRLALFKQPLPNLKARLGARTEFRIYPSIGVARVGDCKDSFLIGPEAPGVVPSAPFRGADKGLKPQAARFRIYKVEIDANENEAVVEEVIAGGDTKIEWSVSLANRKAAALQICDDTLALTCPQTESAQRRARPQEARDHRSRLGHGFRSGRPRAFGRHRVCEAGSEGEDR